MLWASAPQTEKMYPVTGKGSASSTQNVKKDKPPPHRDKKPAVAPRTRKANPALSKTRRKAGRRPSISSAYITTMLDSPIFIAGINPSTGVRVDSKKTAPSPRQTASPAKRFHMWPCYACSPPLPSGKGEKSSEVFSHTRRIAGFCQACRSQGLVTEFLQDQPPFDKARPLKKSPKWCML